MAISHSAQTDLRKLTPRQEAFALLVGAKSLSLSDAYRTTYTASGMKPTTINRSASVLASLPHVGARIRQYRGTLIAAVAKRAAFTMADAMSEAEGARQLANDAGEAGAAVAAVTLKSKLAGLLVDRQAVRVGVLEDSDLDELVAMRDALRTEAAALAGTGIGEPLSAIQGNNRPVFRAE